MPDIIPDQRPLQIKLRQSWLYPTNASSFPHQSINWVYMWLFHCLLHSTNTKRLCLLQRFSQCCKKAWVYSGFQWMCQKVFPHCRLNAELIGKIYTPNVFLAATKRPMVQSVRLSVRHTFLTIFPSSYHHEIFRSYYQWQKWRPCKKSRSEVKGQGHIGKKNRRIWARLGVSGL